MFGNLLQAAGDPERARAIYEQGMEAARRAGNEHALGELQSARAELS
jgi:hypothetical protein